MTHQREPATGSTLLSEQVYARLFEALITNRLAPGDHLNRRQVAEDLGVSVAPVLEALTQLEWEGFVETSPRRGTVVRRITARHVHGRFRLRQGIEVEAARIYAGEPIRRQLSRLLDAADRTDAWLHVNAFERDAVKRAEKIREEIRFHGMLVDLADCPVLAEEYRRVMRHGLYHSALLIRNPQSVDPALHRNLVEALAEASPGEADQLIRDHLASWIISLSEAERSEALATPDGDLRPEKPRRVNLRSLRGTTV